MINELRIPQILNANSTNVNSEDIISLFNDFDNEQKELIFKNFGLLKSYFHAIPFLRWKLHKKGNEVRKLISDNLVDNK